MRRGARCPASEPSPTFAALASTDPQANRVPATTPQARPTKIARPLGTRPPDPDSITDAGATPLDRSPLTQAIKAAAAGPEPDFLRRRAVILRHQRSPQSSG
ncbi:MAG: hypothetical protein ACRDQX_08345, partial [Pseudonocardiaceae bacterium]